MRFARRAAGQVKSRCETVTLNIAIDDDLARKLPLPLAQLYRRAHNAKTPLERHLTAFYLWEAGLKLLGTMAIVHYAQQPLDDARLAEGLRDLARPASATGGSSCDCSCPCWPSGAIRTS